jgi:hypothetical protein
VFAIARRKLTAQIGTERKLPLHFLVQVGMAITLLSIVSAWLSFYFSNTPMRLLSIGLGVSVYLSMMATSENVALKTVSVVLFGLSMPFALANSWSSEFKSLVVPFSFLSGLGSAWYTLEYRKSKAIFEYSFYCYLILTVFLIAVRGYGPADFDDFFSGIGRNGYSAILVATASGYLVSRGLRGLSASVILIGVALACSVFLYGRSSIGALAVVFAFVAFRRSPKISTIMIVAAIWLILIGYAELQALSMLDTNFKAGLDSARWEMLEEYRLALNAKTLVFGVNLNTLPTVVEYDGNPHNAFLRLHSSVGIAAYCFAVVFAMSMASLIRQKQLLQLVVLMAILFRAFTDIILIFGTVDLFFIPLLFYPFFRRYWPERAPVSTGVTSPLIS